MSTSGTGKMKVYNERERDNENSLKFAKDNTQHQSNRCNGERVAVIDQSQINLVDTKDSKPPRECLGARATLGFLGLLGIAMMFSIRFNLSVAIVSMAKSGTKNITNTAGMTQVCLPPDAYNSSEEWKERGEFDWDKATQGHILGAFYYGYIVTNLLGGRAAEYFGGKLIFGWGIILTGIFSILSPLCARISSGLFIAIRILEGLSSGVTIPAINCLLAKWIPPVERTKYSSFVFAGGNLGTVVAMPVSGWLCDIGLLGGWPSVFYVFGALGIVWGIPWYFLVYSSPDLHPRISVAEKTYIKEYCDSKNAQTIPIPWRSILTSIPFWAIAVAHVGFNWGFYTLLTVLPTYLNNVQHFDMTSNGFFSGLPYLLLLIFSVLFGNLMSYLQVTGKLSTITIRRLAMAIGMYGPMAALVTMCFVDCDQVLAMVVICIAVGLCGSIYSGYMCSHQDLSPNLAGTLMGLTNTVATIPGFVAPFVNGLIISGNQTLTAWRTVFLISSFVYGVSGTVYITSISAEIQPWNFPKSKDHDEAGEQEKERS